MFKYYLNQQANLQRKIGENSYSEATFGPEEVVKCRKELANRYVQRTDGSLVFAATLYTTNVATSAGDLLDGRRVINVDAPSLLGGSIPLYWSYVE